MTFVKAEVLSVLVDSETRHFLELQEASFVEATTKRLRLVKRAYVQVANSGGLLIRSHKQLVALKAIGTTAVTIDTDKSDVLPDLDVLKHEKKGQTRRRAQEASQGEGETEVSVDSLEGPRASAALPVKRSQMGGSTRRRNFGPRNTGWMKVETSSEADEAYLQVISFGGDASLTEADVIKALEEEYGIRAGIDRELLSRLTKQAASSPNRVIRGHFVVAQGEEPDAEAVGRIEYTCLEDVPDDVVIPYEALRDAFQQATLGQVLAQSLNTRLVMPGEELAAFLPLNTDQAAKDIFGQVKAPTGGEALLIAGEHVRLMDNRYVAEIHGYVCMVDKEISVIRPVWIAPDQMHAYYIRFPQVGPEAMVTEDWVRQVLAASGVTHGIREERIRELVDDAHVPDGAGDVLLAEATDAVPATDGTVYHPFLSPTDGGMAPLERVQAAMVATGSMIAEITPPTAGTPGRNVLGRQFGEAADTVSLSVSPGDNVRQEETGQRTYFYAEVEGRASVTDGVVHVRPVSYVENNLERPMEVAAGHEVHIRGSIRSGGSVSGAGGVVVEGMVEGGGRVEAKGDVVIGKGVVGRDSRVNSGGNVYCPFVQQGSIIAKGDVYIDGHLIGAQISAGGQLVVRGDGEERNGTAIGGRIVAARGIQARRIGGTRAETKIAIGPDPDLAAQIQTVDNALKS
jgi:uncharacterized protein (DUF342 family)